MIQGIRPRRHAAALAGPVPADGGRHPRHQPKVWNAWKGKLLEDLPLTLRALGGAQPNLDAEIEGAQGRGAPPRSTCTPCPDTEGPAVEDAGGELLRATTRADIAWHARLSLFRLDQTVPVVKARPPRSARGLQVLVYSPDRPDLFARICGYFDSAAFNIPTPRCTTRADYALDTFQVTSPRIDGQDPAHYRRDRDLAGRDAARERRRPPAGRCSRRAAAGRRRVKELPVTRASRCRPDERAKALAAGRLHQRPPGLLYAIARVLARHHVNLQRLPRSPRWASASRHLPDRRLGAAAERSRSRSRAELLDALG